MNGERLWSYVQLTRLWAWSMIVSAGLIGLLAVAISAGRDEGLTQSWLVVFGAVALGTFVGGALFVRFMIAAPSSRLPHATALDDERTPSAGRGDWRRWSLIFIGVLVAGSAAALVFLVATLGEGGTAEGVVVGILAAWGVATLADAHQIRTTERREKRRYFARVQRPTAVGNHLVYVEDHPG